MISIINSHSRSQHLITLRKWFLTQWNEIDPFEGKIPGFLIPVPLLAFKDEELVGGLAFTSAFKPNADAAAIWINAVWVLPEYRGKRIASGLVQKAETAAADIEAKELFAYTNFPALYEKLGWRIVRDSGEFKVLTKKIIC